MFGLKSKLTRLKRKGIPDGALSRQKTRLLAHMSAHPMRIAEGRSAGFAFSYRPVMASFIVLILLGSTGGAVFAAQESLPGEALYPVKIASEEVRARLAFSEEAQFEFRSKLAERRLAEAEELFLHDRGATEARDRRIAIAMDRYESHVERLEGIVERFENQENPKDRTRAIEAIEKVLGTHARLLESATATEDGSDMSVAAYAKGAIELDERLTTRFEKAGNEDDAASDEKRVRFRKDMQRLKSKLEHAEIFRGKPFLRSEILEAPNRNLWPASWNERDGEVSDPDEDAEEASHGSDEEEPPGAAIELRLKAESGVSL